MTALPSKKERVRSPFFIFFHVWRAQFPYGSFATDVPKRTDLMILVWCGECLIRGTRWKKKMGRITSHLLLVRTDGARQERDEGGDDGRIAPRCRRLDGDIPTGREATEQT